jgi:hypothetical protein
MTFLTADQVDARGDPFYRNNFGIHAGLLCGCFEPPSISNDSTGFADTSSAGQASLMCR